MYNSLIENSFIHSLNMNKPKRSQVINRNQVAILGAGESGVGAAILAKQKGWEVFVSDFGEIKENYKRELEENEIEFEEKGHTTAKILNVGQVIKSPGVPDKAPIVKALLEANIPVISEIEFAAQYTDAIIVGITGSNGKTTTTNLIYHILKMARYKVGMAGNVGYSFARMVAEEEHEYYVLELSSFQLDGIRFFAPDIAVLLNISPDHLDRYEYDFDNYIASKLRITMNQTDDNHLIYNAKDENILKQMAIGGTEAITHAVRPSELKVSDWKVNEETFSASELTIKGRHNLFNATCAIKAAMLLEVEISDIKKALRTFKNDPHRLEKIATKNGITYINDSKATNVDAVWYALDAMTEPIVWVVGGTDKGNDYAPLMDLVNEKVKAIICMGIDNSKIHEAFGTQIKIIEDTQSAKEAVNIATKYAESGDVVLLSPACASFDLFKNYKDRGEQFKTAVNELKLK